MAKKYNRGRQQKRNVDQEKQEKFRTEVARELGTEQQEKRKGSSQGNTSTYKEKEENERLS